MRAEFEMTKKQMEGYQKLISKDNNIRWVWFGGGAWWWKTYLWVFWIWSMCMEYPWTRRFFARKTLKALRSTTFMSYQKMCEDMWLPILQRWHLNWGDQVIRFYNKSEIVLVDAAPVSSDPLYLSLWWWEYTGWMIEESNELEKNGVDTLYTRIWRRKNDEYWIPPRILETFNPDKWHIYHRYYKPRKDWKDWSNWLFFVKSLATDNPMISPEYIKNLEKSPMIIKERLLYWNFDYDDTPGRLYDYDSLMNFDKNSQTNGKKWITCDVARSGRDTSIIYLWDWWHIKKRITFETNTTTELSKKIIEIAQQEWITMSDVMADEVGVWWWVVDETWCLGFISNASIYNKVDSEWKEVLDDNYKPVQQNYSTLFDQCCFEMAIYINNNIISSYEYDTMLIEELDIMLEIIKDGKRKIISKDERKKKLWRSPDRADCFVMRRALMYKQMTKSKNQLWSMAI